MSANSASERVCFGSEFKSIMVGESRRKNSEKLETPSCSFCFHSQEAALSSLFIQSKSSGLRMRSPAIEVSLRNSINLV